MGKYKMSNDCELAKQYLLQLLNKYKELQRLSAQYEQDKVLMYGSNGGIDYSKTHVAGGKVTTGNGVVEMMVDRYAELERLKSQYLTLQKDIARMIETLDYPIGTELLTKRYLIYEHSGKLRSFEDISDDLDIGLRRCYRIHKTALSIFYQKFLKK